jgi:hypothetical protein
MGLDMRRLHIKIVIIFISLSVMVSSAAWGEEIFTADMEAELLELINSARSNPLEMAVAVGLDPEQVLTDLPWLFEELTQGLSPLRSDSALAVAARNHTEDMLEKDYYGYDSQDGSTADDRISNTGYLAEVTDESLGLLGFFNYVDPSKAVFQIFSTLYRDELNPERIRPRNILDSEFRDIGIGFGAGKLTLKGVSFNVYVVTCDFGAPMVSGLELELLQLINQARENPIGAMEAYGIDLGPFLETDTDTGLYEILTTPVIPSLVSDASLRSASKAHSEDMLANDFFDHVSSDGESLEERVIEEGYDPAVLGEVIQRVGLSAFTDSEVSHALQQIMEQVLRDEIANYVDFGVLTLLNPDLRDMGIGMVSGRYEVDGEAADVLISTVTLGSEVEEGVPSLVGTIYSDDDGNGIYSYGEGLSEIRVTIESVHTLFEFQEFHEVWTDKAGGFQYPLDSGLHRVTIYVPGMEPTEYFLTPKGENVRLAHELPENWDSVEMAGNGP